jgi:outer membrane protein OmpA-like peptidoglycan-associated protein
MKKLLIALAFVGLGTAANAQSTQIETPSKYTVATNSFWSNWFVQFGVDMSVMNPYKTSFFKEDWHEGRTYGIDLAIGKWFTPGLGLRTKVQWENGLFAHAFRNSDHVIYAPDFHKGGYGAIYEDVQFNLTNLFKGYDENRVWNFIIYPRAGIVRNFDAAENAFTLGGGIQNMWKLNKVISVYADLAYNFVSTKDFVVPNWVPTDANNHKHGYATVELGVNFNLGKGTWAKAVTLDQYNALAAASEEALAKLRAELDKERAENARLRAELAKQPKGETAAKVEKVIASAATSVFFELNSTALNSKKDLVNLEAVASAAKESGAKVTVTGSADSKTGSSAWNQKLSEGRAQAVADELVRLGVSRDNITVKAIGGVNEVSPYTLNRRAVIELK